MGPVAPVPSQPFVQHLRVPTSSEAHSNPLSLLKPTEMNVKFVNVNRRICIAMTGAKFPLPTPYCELAVDVYPLPKDEISLSLLYVAPSNRLTNF